MRVADFLEVSAEEKHCFMLLVQKGKAGSITLENYYQAQILELRSKRQMVRERIQVKEELAFQDQMTYYSAWWFVAVHILCALPGTQTREELRQQLSLSAEVIDSTLKFLLEKGLIRQKSGQYSIGKRRIHLGTSSALLPRHHSNWRLRALQAVDHPKPGDLHYSGIIGISKKDGEKLRAMMLDFLQNSETIVRDSQEDTGYVMLLDFFEL
jgi:DNA-binding HxlR family transcriptional regulator